MQLSYIYMDSPVAQLQLVANETALVAVLWDCENRIGSGWQLWLKIHSIPC